MRHQEATVTVAAPLARVEAVVADVAGWPRFIVELESAERLGHERWRFCLRDGGDRRDVVVCVRHDPARHRTTWRALEGPQWTGCLSLAAVDDGHTRVRLELDRHPGSFLAGLAEMLMPRTDRAAHDLHDLEDVLAVRG